MPAGLSGAPAEPKPYARPARASRHRNLAAAAVGVLICVLAPTAGCGGKDVSSTPAGASGDDSGDPPGIWNGQHNGALRAYRNCLTGHGASASGSAGTPAAPDATGNG